MTTAKIEPPRSKKKLLMLAGACGILEVIVIMVSVSLAILYSPGFDLAQNWVSDLTGMGYTYFENVARPVISSPVTEILARSGFIIGGILGIVFSFGLFYDDDTPSHRLGAVFVLLGAAAFCTLGIFPESFGLIHFVAGYVVFLMAPIGILLIGGAFSDASHKWLGYLSIALGIIALAGTSMASYGRGIAELPIIFGIVVWIVIYSIRMLRSGSRLMQI